MEYDLHLTTAIEITINNVLEIQMNPCEVMNTLFMNINGKIFSYFKHFRFLKMDDWRFYPISKINSLQRARFLVQKGT